MSDSNSPSEQSRAERQPAAPVDSLDRRLIVATQHGLPLVARPYHALAEQLGIAADDVMRRFRAMQQSGVIRRIAAVPNHYAVGYRANGMSVWDVPDEQIEPLGQLIGALEFVSHCYQRPRYPPQWPYCLFAMLHGRSRGEVREQVAQIAAMLGTAVRGYEVLYSTRILKKTGLRLTGNERKRSVSRR